MSLLSQTGSGVSLKGETATTGQSIFTHGIDWISFKANHCRNGHFVNNNDIQYIQVTHFWFSVGVGILKQY